MISKAQNKPSSNIYFKNLYNDYNIDWPAISVLPCFVKCNTYMPNLNVLFHNKKPHPFGIKLSPLCSFCNLYDETPFHIFYERDECLWSDLIKCFQNNLILPTLTPQTVIFGFLDSANNDSIFENNKAFRNHILPIFMLYVYM